MNFLHGWDFKSNDACFLGKLQGGNGNFEFWKLKNGFKNGKTGL